MGKKNLFAEEKMDLNELKEMSEKWVRYHNSERLYQVLGYRTPDEVYYEGRMVRSF